MSTAAFDFASVIRQGTPAPAVKFGGFPKYNFVGGHNDAESVPVAGLVDAAAAVLRREGRTLATYGLESGSQGYRPLREFVAGKVKADAGIVCSADDVLITSGSNQGLDLVNALLVTPGDTVLVEAETYAGALGRLNRAGAKIVGVPLDQEGLRLDSLEAILAEHKARGVRPKYIYTIPTVQNPTGAIMGAERRHKLLALAQAYGVPIFEDECYADLIWEGGRAKALYAMTETANVIHLGSFSKSIAPAPRLGYLIAPWPVLSRLIALKFDGGTGAIDQMVLAEYSNRHFHEHVRTLNRVLKSKRDVVVEALEAHFGTAAEYEVPKGGIFIWVRLPAEVDTSKLAQVALASGVAINPGAEWSTDAATGKRKLRICFANPSPDRLREGVALLAEICRKEFGVPARIANVKRG